MRRLVESAVEKCQAIDWGTHVERQPLRRYAATFGVIAVAALALFTLGPRFLRHGLSALLVCLGSVEAAAPYRIEVTPGQRDRAARRRPDDHREARRVRRRSGVADGAQGAGRAVRARAARAQREQHEANKYEGMLFDLAGPIDYFVEANGVKSATFTLKVVDLPYVQQLELEYHFPAYTGLAPRKIEDGGDIAVLKGTEVRVKATPTMAARGRADSRATTS